MLGSRTSTFKLRKNMASMLADMLILVLTLVAGASAESSSCPRGLTAAFYRELGCAPKVENNAPCPTSYDCSLYAGRDSSRCYHKGKSYEIGQDLPDEVGGTCSASCRCVNDPQPSFVCANVECPEYFGLPIEPDCHFVYEHGRCCSTNKVCSNQTAVPPTTCTHGNETYLLGQRFYPEDDQCKVCYCKENFQGKLEPPFCYDIKCDELLHSGKRINEGCAPVYFGRTGCCPIDWKCPGSNDAIMKVRTKIRPRTTKNCQFGSLTLQPGEKLDTGDALVDCSCILPPYLTCVQERD